MDATKRTLLRVEIVGDRAATSDAVNALMGSKPEARFRFIQERAAFASDVKGWAASFAVPSFARDPKSLVKLKSFLTTKLPA